MAGKERSRSGLEGYPSHDDNKRDWYQFVKGEGIGADVRPEVAQSWERCRKAGISPYLTITRKLDDQQLAEVLEKDRPLITTSKPLIRHLYQFLAGSGFIVTLCNRDGIILYALGDPEALEASHGNMVQGADWSEQGIGANSIGTTLYLDSPTRYWGFEHYCRMPQRWAGSGAPIHDPNGELIGCLNISGQIERSHLHTQGMVVITAQAISKQIKLENIIRYSMMINQHQQIIMNTMSEGLLVLDKHLNIILANRHIANRLKTSVEVLKGQNIEEICKDHRLLKRIGSHSEETDYITNLEFNGTSYACTVTCRTISEDGGAPEILLLTNDISRVRKLAQKLVSTEPLLGFQDIVGEDEKFRSVIRLAMAAAETAANVLILGESGTGKEVFAQAIHSGSPRANGPFIAINCSAIPKELVASILFGYEDGAYTGAKKGGSPGKFELADHGTLFLDEIGELPLDTQAVLLRVLESKSFTRVGGKEEISVDVRIIAATNRDLLYESRMKYFRQDLYYRLNVFSIALPPLRERRGDIPLLANYFLQRMNRRYRRKVDSVSEDAMELFLQYDWPGNIRELQNVIERAVVISDGDKIGSSLVAMSLPVNRPAETVSDQKPEAEQEPQPPVSEEDERRKILRLLEECKWNVSKTAVRLGVARSTLYRKMYYYGLKTD